MEEPIVELSRAIKINDVFDGYFGVNTVDSVSLVRTPVDVTTDDWICTILDQNGDTVIEMSTDNGYLTLSNTNRVNYSIPANETQDYVAGPITGELKNLTTGHTILKFKGQIVQTGNAI